MSKKRWMITADKFLSPEQVERLIQHLLAQRDLAIARQNNTQAIRDYYAIRTLLESGLRVFEFCALVNGDFSGLKLIVRRGKGNKPRTVLLTRSTANMLKEWQAVKSGLGIDINAYGPMFPSRYGSRYTTRGMQKRVKIIFAQLGFPEHLSIHSLRHTYCSLLLASRKVSLATVKENLGHHSIAVTNLYAHAIDDLSEVELYSSPSSHKTELSELRAVLPRKKANPFASGVLRNMNFKRPAHTF